MSYIHDEEDKRNIEIEKIGIENYKLPITFESNNFYNTIADIESGVSLSSSVKGAHLSRIVETLDKYISSNYISIQNFNELLML